MILGDLLKVIDNNIVIYKDTETIDTTKFSELMRNFDNVVDNVSANSYGQLVIKTHEE
jgi:hypothetical protein